MLKITIDSVDFPAICFLVEMDEEVVTIEACFDHKGSFPGVDDGLAKSNVIRDVLGAQDGIISPHVIKRCDDAINCVDQILGEIGAVGIHAICQWVAE